MTDLHRLVKRRTCRPAQLVRRHLVVMLEPGDTLAIREAGRRLTYRIALERLYKILVQLAVEKKRRDDEQARKLRKALTK